ncbi:putative nucleic acid-binding protein, contains PIN domain [Candidatus Methanophagaceae archaeon]|nr:putative nucleic acid-binding protein, contains PIN domain [Methanophagales archaeon]
MIDSWAWIEYFRGSKAGEQIKGVIEDSEEKMVISTINIAEVYRLILRFYSEDFAEEKIEAMKQRAFVCDVIEEIAVEAAKIKHKKKWGLGDSLIYATAKKEGARVLTGDPDFKDVEGVIFIE